MDDIATDARLEELGLPTDKTSSLLWALDKKMTLSSHKIRANLPTLDMSTISIFLSCVSMGI